MSTRLVILGLLRERPLYGYEIKQIIEEQMGDWTNIAFGSIYFALKKLAEEGCVEQVAVEQEGNRPSRTIYRLTPAGRDEFVRSLRALWREPERQFYAIDVGLAFMDALPRPEILGYLQARIAGLEGALAHIDAHRAEQIARPEVPAAAAAVFDHALAHTRAELGWLRGVLAGLEAAG
jgi:DNA-binding PadR family transcriptional regulator